MANNKDAERFLGPKNGTSVDGVLGIAPIIAKKEPAGKQDGEKPLGSKIIFLGKENLEKMRGYKAFLEVWPDGELRLTITGLSLQSGGLLFASLDRMKDEEIHGK